MSNSNDSAFPQRKAIGSDGTFVDESAGGLTARAYIAARVLPELVRLNVVQTHSFGFRIRLELRRLLPCIFPPVNQTNEHFTEQCAEWAVKYADALIAELNK